MGEKKEIIGAVILFALILVLELLAARGVISVDTQVICTTLCIIGMWVI